MCKFDLLHHYTPSMGQLLRLLSPFYVEPTLYYWSRELASSSAEIDYLIQDNQRLIPIEVKAGVEGKLRSLHQKQRRRL